ncbi:MAG: hypothetical protein IPM23_13885 [Candidatus Melainabacteria bacterium]|nr:hypothetical protein [Candidatus Melainabacteria bacterium]
MLKSKILFTLLTAATAGALGAPAAMAQPFPGDPVQPGPAPGAPVETLRTPLITGQPSAPPFVPPPEGQPPAIGDGSTPAPVTGGHAGAPVTLLPWVPVIPSNQIDQGSSGIPLPVDPAITSPPGVLGPALAPFIPAPPSTPGADPGSLTAPAGSFNPADELNINPGGGIPGTGGFYTSIPTTRRGGQESHQYGYRGRNSILGGGASDGSQDNVERLGPWAGYGAVFGVPTGDGWRNSSIDLGGGQRFKSGGNVIPTGSTVQDYGLSSTRDHVIGALQSQQSTEFGQGMRRLPLYSSKTTDFGFPYTQFDPANVNAQKQDHLMNPTAIITNF